ncbi:hypothetical protein AB4090_15090, partial [Acidithiobacillus sp. IBUN Pt1247-S3]|uniref:hypothetical protein n=1 Tax=Acidithiobacillus sp. IBUN Pt1247-S3 TaxID=3166642 RepID=UPI0034E3F348
LRAGVMWVLVVLFVVAAMIDDGRPAAIMVSLVGAGLLLAVMGNLVGMIWPWPKGREWQDAEAKAGWSCLVHARRDR